MIIDISGKRFGKLVALSVVNVVNEMARWRCRCDCGKEAVVNGASLRNGHTRSCGCLWRKHGGSDTPTFRGWSKMRARCENPKHADYADYGGRGIKVCARWSSFPAFLVDMGVRPPGMSIERIDVNGDYEPTNCCWATTKQQNNNKRNSKYVTHAGETLTVGEWADRAKVRYAVLYKRVFVLGWDFALAISAPALPKGKRRTALRHEWIKVAPCNS